MFWHVMVYSRGLESAYSHPYAVHLFTSSKPSPNEAFRMAEEILSKTFPDWGKDKREYLAYVGYEELPLSLPPEAEGSYVAVKFLISMRVENAQFISTVPPTLVSILEKYRMEKLTLDYDGKDDHTKADIIDVLDTLLEKNISFKIYETHRGYHIRASLPQPLPLEEILKMRKGFGDDNARLDVDSHYLHHGFGFLTNLLFNEKYWWDFPRDNLQCTIETEINPKKIMIEFKQFISFTLPEISINIPSKGIIEVKGSEVVFKGSFGLKEMRRIVQSIEDNLWEYAYAQRSQSNMINSLIASYRKISPTLSTALERCKISFSDGVIVIHVPENLSPLVGRLIGKQGQNIRAVEAELGIKIRISQSSPPPEDVEMKRKLQDLLGRVV
ncbi:MAG: KH domain-containing protein [Thermofilaceae archaeon]